MKITKVEIRFVSDGGAVVETHPIDVPKDVYAFGYHFDRVPAQEMTWLRIPQPKMVKREGWINRYALYPSVKATSTCENDVSVSWEEPE